MLLRMVAIAAAALVTLGLSAAPDQKPPDLSAVKVLVQRATDYVRAYQKDFAFLVADERYTQEVAIRGVEDHQKRVTTGEMFPTTEVRSGPTNPMAVEMQ